MNTYTGLEILLVLELDYLMWLNDSTTESEFGVLNDFYQIPKDYLHIWEEQSLNYYTT